MNRFDHAWARLALICALVGALGLAACGRKGPLDLPPAAMASQPAPGQPASGPIGAQSQVGNPGVDENGKPTAPPGPSKRIPLDVLLN